MKSVILAQRPKLTLLMLSLLFVSGSVTTLAKSKSQAQVSTKSKQSVIAHKALVARGKALFAANQCLDCHQVAGKGCVDGISLDGIGKIRTDEFLTEQLKDPEAHVARALRNFHGETSLMASPNLSKSEIKAVVAYLRTLPAPSGSKAMPNAIKR